MRSIAFGMALVFATAGSGAADAADKTLAARYHQDFGDAFDPRELGLLGGETPSRYCRLDSAGLRCTIPPDQSQVSVCGIDARFIVRGDFEITAAYRILELPQPRGGHGAGVKISIKDEQQEWASLQRLRQHRDPDIYSAHRAVMKENSYKHSSEMQSTEAMSGRLRLVRAGTTLLYLVADGESDDFVELRRTDFPAGDLSQLYFVAQTGGSPTLVDVVWTELDVRAEEIVSPYDRRRRRSNWPLVAVVIVVGLSIAGLGLLRWRHGGAA